MLEGKSDPATKIALSFTVCTKTDFTFSSVADAQVRTTPTYYAPSWWKNILRMSPQQNPITIS